MESTNAASLTQAPPAQPVQRHEDDDGAPVQTEPKRAPAGAKFLTKAEIAVVDDIVFEDVEVPEWSGWVRVRGLTAGERSQIENRMLKVDPTTGGQTFDGREMRQLFIAYAMIDPNTGARLFSNKELAVLAGKSGAATDRIYEVATRLSRVSKADLADMAKNSGSDLSDDSSGGTDEK